MEPTRDDQLIADLQALRPTPRPRFAAELDERAAAGFPRRSPLPRFSFERLRGISTRRLVVATGALALLAIVVATALVSTSGPDHGPSAEVAALLPEEQHDAALPARASNHAASPAPSQSHGPAGVVYGGESSALPSAVAEGESGAESSAGGSAAPSYTTAEQPLRPVRHRAVERSADITLAADPEDVDDDAARVFEAVHANDGIVMRSSTREGRAGEAGATFELLIPSAKLGDTMAAFSDIDAVRSRHEATADITKPTVTAADLLQDSKARVDSLLAQLGEAETDGEREAVKAELRQERRHRAYLRARFQHLQRRADFSRVLLRIETGGKESSGGGWGIDEALHDAGHVLTVAVAVTLIALAVLGPIALIALLAWLTHRAWVRRERRRVLS